MTAVCDTANVELVRGLGADRVIDRTTQDFTKDGQTYDLVLDAVGKSSFGRCKRSLEPRGIYISSDLGPFSQNPILALITPLFRGRKVMFPIPPKHSRREVGYIKETIESGAFRPVIDRRYRLDQIVEAYRYVETGQKIGNVVIEIVTPGCRTSRSIRPMTEPSTSSGYRSCHVSPARGSGGRPPTSGRCPWSIVGGGARDRRITVGPRLVPWERPNRGSRVRPTERRSLTGCQDPAHPS